MITSINLTENLINKPAWHADNHSLFKGKTITEISEYKFSNKVIDKKHLVEITIDVHHPGEALRPDQGDLVLLQPPPQQHHDLLHNPHQDEDPLYNIPLVT